MYLTRETMKTHEVIYIEGHTNPLIMKKSRYNNLPEIERIVNKFKVEADKEWKLMFAYVKKHKLYNKMIIMEGRNLQDKLNESYQNKIDEKLGHPCTEIVYFQYFEFTKGDSVVHSSTSDIPTKEQIEFSNGHYNNIKYHYQRNQSRIKMFWLFSQLLKKIIGKTCLKKLPEQDGEILKVNVNQRFYLYKSKYNYNGKYEWEAIEDEFMKITEIFP